MTEFIFMWLQKLGYTHPLHAPITHVPMGMVMGGFVFALFAHVVRKPELFRTALHCYVLALLATPPAMFVGYMDWQHFYRGEANPYVTAKILLGALLLALCVVNIRLLRKETSPRLPVLAACGFSMVVAGLLGFLGGALQYGS